VVLQDSLLFGATIRENIAYGRPDATQEEIERAAWQAHAHDFIMALPEKYETVLGERGMTLSGGQRQRIGLARAIIKRPSILILDEPTSAVDAESEKLIWDAVERLQQGRTVLVVAHQLSTIKRCHRVLVLKAGAVLEKAQGSEAMRNYL
jgi:ABC-type multidrug transport system fused ATPase/permease subunit